MEILNNLPVELILIVISYSDDIDLRIKFKIFNKINLEKFRFLEATTRNLELVRDFVENHCYRIEY